MCKNKVTQYVPQGFSFKAIEMKCGNTGIDGEMLLCDAPPSRCDNKNQSGRPWYICPHGNDVSEYLCGACEAD